MNPGSALEPEEQALPLPRLVPRPPGAGPHFLRKAKLPKQINQSVKSSLGERLSQLAQPRNSKGNCSRSLRRKQQIVLRGSSSACCPAPPPTSLGCREHLCAGDQPGTAPPLLLAPRAVPSPEPLLWEEGTEPLFGSCPSFAWETFSGPVCLVALGTRRVTRVEVGLASKYPSGQTPHWSWRPGGDGDQ